MEKILYCKNCKWREEALLSILSKLLHVSSGIRCKRPEISIFDTSGIVNGNPSLTCYEARDKANLCGPGGRYYDEDGL